MSWTWNEVIALSLVRSGIVGRGQTANAQNTDDGKKTLELLLDELDGEGLSLPPFSTELKFNTIAGQARYLLGIAANGELTGAYPIRPESVITGTVQISSGPAVIMTMQPLDFEQYTMLAVPSISGQPWNYAVNPRWPQMEVYLYPTPNAVLPVVLNCKLKWKDTGTLPPDIVNDPSLNIFANAQIPSGYINALVNMLAHKLAQIYRLETATLSNLADEGKFLIMSLIAHMVPPDGNTLPRGLFPWNIGIAGRNP